MTRWVFAVALGLGGTTAWAAEDPKPAEGTAPAGALSTGGLGMEGREPTDVLRFDPLVIEGRPQKPQAIQLLRKTSVSFADLVPEESFLPRIVEATESEPF